MGIFVVGVNHKECPVEVREKIHFTAAQLRGALDQAKKDPDLTELLILSTCNRVEFYGFSNSEKIPADKIHQLIASIHHLPDTEFKPFLYSYANREAVRHFFRVAAGLDSLVVGENEILGQVREAFREANAAASVHSFLYRLAEHGLKVGKAVRSETKINQGAVGIASVAVELAQKIFGHLSGEKVMVLGTGEMSTQTLSHLKSCGASILYVISRHEPTGQAAASEYGAKWASFDDWEKHLDDVDILIASTASPHPIVKFSRIKEVMTRRHHRPLFMIDIAVPRNIESKINSIDDVFLYNIDDLKGIAATNLRMRKAEVEAAEKLVESAVEEYQSWIERLKARPTLERFEAFLDDVLEQEMDRLKRRSGISEEEVAEIRQRIRSKLMHPPLHKIKQASQNGGVHRYLEALHSLFDLDKD